ncbi:hypothetical protein Tco_0867863 [Tanacetum coccineum]
MSDFPNVGFPKDGFWNLLTSNMNPGSTLNAQFPGFSSQFPMSPEQQAFLLQQQQAFVEFEQNFQNEETLLASCYVAVFEDKNVGKAQPKDTFWYRILNEFNRLNFQKRTKDMLSSKWNTLNHNCQKFNAIYKRCSRLTKSGESELDVMKWARATYRDENKNTPFTQEDAWELLRKHAKWDVPPPAPVDLTEDENIPAVNTDELFGPDARTCPTDKQRPGKKTNSDTSVSTGGSSSSSQFGEIMTKELSSQMRSR